MTPKKPGPAPRAAHRGPRSRLVGADQLAAGGHHVDRDTSRTPSPRRRLFQPWPPWSRKPPMPTLGQCPPGNTRPCAVRNGVSSAPPFDRRAAVATVAGRSLSRASPEVDQQRVVAHAPARPAVPARAHRHLPARARGRAARRDDVLLAAAPSTAAGVRSGRRALNIRRPGPPRSRGRRSRRSCRRPHNDRLPPSTTISIAFR